MDLTNFHDRTRKNAELMATPDAQLGPGRRLSKELMKLNCRAYSTNPDFYSAPPGMPSRDEMNETCKPYFDELGVPGPMFPQPFTGGQCPDEYRLEWTYSDPGRTFSAGRYVRGPISIKLEKGNTDSYGTFYDWILTQEVGIVDPPQRSSLGGYRGFVPPTLNVTSLYKTSGQADNCGNQGPYGVPGGAPVYNYGDEITINVDDRQYDVVVNQPVTNNIDKSITVPIFINGDVGFNFGGDGLGGASDSGQAPSDRPNVSSGLPIGGPIHEDLGEKFVDPPEGKEYAGCIVELFDVETGSPPVPSSLPDKVWPFVIGNARLIYANSGIGDILGEAKLVREDMFVLFRPADRLKVVGAKMRLSYPGTYSITPLLVDKVTE